MIIIPLPCPWRPRDTKPYELIIRKSECEELGLEVNAKAALEDVGHNADLCIAIQEDNTQN